MSCSLWHNSIGHVHVNKVHLSTVSAVNICVIVMDRGLDVTEPGTGLEDHVVRILTEPHRIKPLIQLFYDNLSSPFNLFFWVLADSLASPLWQRRGSQEYILGCCMKGLGVGCYCSCHDQQATSSQGLGEAAIVPKSSRGTPGDIWSWETALIPRNSQVVLLD